MKTAPVSWPRRTARGVGVVVAWLMIAVGLWHIVPVVSAQPYGPRYDVLRASPLTIDGDLSDWPLVPDIPLAASNASSHLFSYPSPMDASSYTRFLWDEDYLYVAISVTDDRLVADSDPIWEDDAFEVGLDGANDLKPRGADDRQFTVAADGRIAREGAPITDVQAAVRRRIDGWDAELAIPASLLNQPRFRNWQMIPFNLGLIDDDLGGKADAYMTWQGARTWAVEETWGALRLLPDAAVAPTPGPTPSPTPPGDTVTLQDGFGQYEGTRDTFISQWDPDANQGGASTIQVRSNEVLSALLRFDLEALPDHARIKRATLSLFAVDRTNPQGISMWVYTLQRPWEERQATWRLARDGEPWTKPGASGPGDRSAFPFASAVASRLEDWTSIDVTSAVQAWIEDPEANDGLILVGEQDGSVAYRFYSREAEGDAAPYRPQLIISYWEPTPTPVPTPTPQRVYMPLIRR